MSDAVVRARQQSYIEFSTSTRSDTKIAVQSIVYSAYIRFIRIRWRFSPTRTVDRPLTVDTHPRISQSNRSFRVNYYHRSARRYHFFFKLRVYVLYFVYFFLSTNDLYTIFIFKRAVYTCTTIT